MPQLNQHQANNTRGVPGLRLNFRKGHRVIDVTWNDDTGRRHGTSYLLGERPVIAVERAILRRQEETSCTYPITARQAWNRLRGWVK